MTWLAALSSSAFSFLNGKLLVDLPALLTRDSCAKKTDPPPQAASAPETTATSFMSSSYQAKYATAPKKAAEMARVGARPAESVVSDEERDELRGTAPDCGR